jgi:caa(3)-type oxidase subunit IV
MTETRSELSAEVTGYLVVFATLLALTMATVIVSRLHLPTMAAIGVAVAIAVVKASLVAMVFMHLKTERTMVHGPLLLTAILFVALLLFVLWTEGDHLFGTTFGGAFEGSRR